MIAGFRSGTTIVNGVTIHHITAGDGPTVLLLPGWPQTCYAWRHVMRRLADAGFRALAIDLPGLGASDPLSAYDTGRVADLLHQLHLGPCHLVGHDIGSWIAFAWASRYPAGISRLVLLDAALPGPTPSRAFEIDNAARIFQFYFNAVPDLPEILTAGRERALLAWLFRTKAARADAIGPADLDEYLRSYSDPARMSAGFGYYRAVPTTIAQNRAAAPLSMKVMALGGEYGVGTAMLTALREHAADLQGGELAGFGHYLPEECPDLLTTRLLEFFEP